MKRKKIVVMGFMGSMPIAGVIWQHIHYIVGLQRLGHEVYYIEDSARIPYNPTNFDTNNDYCYAAQILGQLASEFGFERRWSFCARYLPENPTAGISLTKIRQLYRDADAILNVCGAQEFNDDLLQSERILYVESDPGVEQIKVDKKTRSTIDYLGKHHALFTFGENIGTDRFPVPLHQLKWFPTRQPIVTDLWKTSHAPRAAAVFTSIANWSTSGLKDIEWRGENYLWSKSREFLRFVAAPQRAGEVFELATDIRDDPTRAKFLANDWRFRRPHEMSVDYCGLPQLHPRARKANSRSRKINTCGFTPGGSAIAAPAISRPGGRSSPSKPASLITTESSGGLFAFRSLGQIAEAVRAINADYKKQSRAAFAVAREVFEAEKVLRDLLDRAGV